MQQENRTLQCLLLCLHNCCEWPVEVACCCGHLLAPSCSLASLSLFFRALCSLISRSILSISPPDCSHSSPFLGTLSTKAHRELSLGSTESVTKSLFTTEPPVLAEINDVSAMHVPPVKYSKHPHIRTNGVRTPG